MYVFFFLWNTQESCASIILRRLERSKMDQVQENLLTEARVQKHKHRRTLQQWRSQPRIQAWAPSGESSSTASDSRLLVLGAALVY
jgi:hypothetical protein